jgi:hypothetical protein
MVLFLWIFAIFALLWKLGRLQSQSRHELCSWRRWGRWLWGTLQACIRKRSSSHVSHIWSLLLCFIPSALMKAVGSSPLHYDYPSFTASHIWLSRYESLSCVGRTLTKPSELTDVRSRNQIISSEFCAASTLGADVASHMSMPGSVFAQISEVMSCLSILFIKPPIWSSLSNRIVYCQKGHYCSVFAIIDDNVRTLVSLFLQTNSLTGSRRLPVWLLSLVHTFRYLCCDSLFLAVPPSAGISSC